ncbi:uncharacterized protein KY384_005304 [Bacidia gigantensis]|uniref:uncharacterized protein n=1 Tax=Bacidia gigantensis TaxID=2732470 RepID=UPI001D05ABE8|nr:uncharacterized protein KY384_005304 [Bacidia gigantensis]KAG8529823.1 hypothetical protein KY384_005304 [Bacidia gigantensis]
MYNRFLDILVSGPFETDISRNTVAAQLGAADTVQASGSPTTSFAVKHPQLPETFVQIDVHVCSTDTFEWEFFHQSYGDLWNLLGTMIRPLGLTANDAGMHLRIEEIEMSNKKRSMLLLTKSPTETLKFLDLNEKVYERGFSRVEQMFDFIRACRFFDVSAYCRHGLKANDRKRLAQREVFREFVDNWVPKNWHSELDAFSAFVPSRREVTKEALDVFKKEEQCKVMVRQWTQERSDLLRRQEARASRKDALAEDEQYVNAWSCWLTQNAEQE